MQWTIDPSLNGDAHADKPYLYSPALASWNRFRVGEKVDPGKEKLPNVHGLVLEEGEEDGVSVREKHGVPESVDGRRGYFQNEEKRKEWDFQADRIYFADFGNQYLDFNGWSSFPVIHNLLYRPNANGMMARFHSATSWV